jgi:hypothetical protein
MYKTFFSKENLMGPLFLKIYGWRATQLPTTIVVGNPKELD